MNPAIAKAHDVHDRLTWLAGVPIEVLTKAEFDYGLAATTAPLGAERALNESLYEAVGALLSYRRYVDRNVGVDINEFIDPESAS